MLEIQWVVLIAAASLVLGFVICNFIMSGKVSGVKKELDFIKNESENLKKEKEDAQKAKEGLLLSTAEAERELAVGKVMLETEKALHAEAEKGLSVLKAKYDAVSDELKAVSAKLSAVEEANKNLKEWISNAETGLKDSFASLSKTITEQNTKVFLETAGDKVGGIITPVAGELKELRAKVGELEEKRAAAYSGLNEKVETLGKQNTELKNATDLLNSTLKNNSQRGKWGEEQLRRIAELSGMVEHIDFEQQEVNFDGSRPDMVIHLTGGRTLPVDSKAPMNAYLLYLDDTDEASRNRHLLEHVKALKNHIDVLNKKAYWKSEDRSAEMVAMVVPYESGLSSAFATDRDIFSYAMEKNVLLLSPMTFYAFLKSVSMGWQENAMSQNAKEIAKQSRELIKRFESFYSHFDAIDRALKKARDEYDSAVGSYNRRLLPSFNRFQTLSKGTETEALLEEAYAETGENILPAE